MPSSSMRSLGIALSAGVLLVSGGCAQSRNLDGIVGGNAVCIGCHGGRDNQTGAPPYDAHGLSSSAAVGAHTAHVDAGVRCDSCHVVPTQLAFPRHQNGVADVIFGTAATDPSGATSPTWDGSTHTCSNVYCHAPSTIGTPGSGPTAPGWSDTISAGCGACHQPPGTIHGGVAATLCATCHPGAVDGTGALVPGGTHLNRTVDAYRHPAGWATANAKGVTPHGLAATYQDKAAYPTGFAGCKACHGSNLDNPIASTVPTCDGCHAAAWRTNCTFCHGDPARTTAALRPVPPRDVQGNTTSTKVGAHLAHLLGDPTNTPVISDGVACTDCHGGTGRTLPNDFVHAAGTTEPVTLKRPGDSAATGSYDPASGTCTNTYCHGNLPRNPKAGNSPSWTQTSGQSSCGTCHAANGALCGASNTCSDTLTGHHETHRCARCHQNSSTSSFSTRVGCFACHPNYQRQLGGGTTGTTLVAPRTNLAIHVDGAVEVVGTTSGLYNGFSLTLSYTAPSGTTPASCTTNCHSIGAHGVGSGSQTW